MCPKSQNRPARASATHVHEEMSSGEMHDLQARAGSTCESLERDDVMKMIRVLIPVAVVAGASVLFTNTDHEAANSFEAVTTAEVAPSVLVQSKADGLGGPGSEHVSERSASAISASTVIAAEAVDVPSTYSATIDAVPATAAAKMSA